MWARDGQDLYRDHLNQREKKAGTLVVSHVTELHHTHTSPKQRLSSVYYTGLQGEIYLK